jgi:hypothetical protein
MRGGLFALRVEQARWTSNGGWAPEDPGALGSSAQLVLAFGERSILREAEPLATLRRAYPSARVLGCSTAGEIHGTRVSDDSLVATAVRFDHTKVHGAQTRLDGAEDSFSAGRRLAAALPHDGLAHIFVLSRSTGAPS